MSDASTPTEQFPVTERTTIGRNAKRATRDRATAEAILDEGVLCHVGLTADHGPVVIPTTYARRGGELLIHGSPAASWLRAAGKGTPVCVTVTHVDGLVLARSAFHHSMNYRSVVVFGVAQRITDAAEKASALDAIVEHIVPGRTGEVRPTWQSEITETLVLRLPLAEASVKVRSGGPIDDDEDYALPDVWAGVIPMETTFGAPVDDDRLAGGIPAPLSATDYHRP